ncbi:MAG: hypothetical protein LUQ65_12520 [Candidatus Helarchaeota archaeon]|nr:hypothetical protein [Candidatus Helarchaeota archaeon]
MLVKEIEEIQKTLKEHDRRLLALEKSSQVKLVSSIGESKKKLSIIEFLRLKKPDGDVKRTLAIGYYLEKYLNMASFHIKDLERAFAETRIPFKEINIGDKVQKNIKRGHMAEALNKKENLKAWLLTGTGDKHVQTNFKQEE